MQNKILVIQILRAVAAIAVVLCHVEGHYKGMAQTYALGDAWINNIDPFRAGQCGVDIFFIISGFIMAFITSQSHKTKGVCYSFLKKRLIRIVPAYWLWTFVILALLLFLPQLFSVRVFRIDEAIYSLFFIPYTPFSANTSPVLAVGWTLRYEVIFYILVALGLHFSRQKFIVLLGIFFVVTTFVFPYLFNTSILILSDGLIWEFYAGFILYELYVKKYIIPYKFSIILLTLSLFSFFFFSENITSNYRFIYMGIPSFVLVYSLLSLDAYKQFKYNKMILFVGDSSYTLYLSHLIVMPGIVKLFVLAGMHTILPPDVQIIIYTIVVTVMGCILYSITEKPMLEKIKKLCRA